MMSGLRSSALLPLTAAVAIAACGSTATSTRDAPPSPVPLAVIDSANARVELLWDDFGVPHIFAKDPAALFYAFGWAQMRSHADLILRMYGQSRARAAEYWGEAYIDSDLWLITNGVPARAEAWLAAQPGHIRAYLDAFVGGMNSYAAHHPDAISDAFEVVLPLRPVDVLAHMNRVVHFGFVANPLMVSAARRHLQLPGSNGWAIGSARSASGNPLLLINPHLPWADYFTWYEAHLSLPDVNAYGATFVGMPFIGLGFNEHLGWTHTVNTIDNVDLYDIETRADGYIYDGAVRVFERDEHVLRVRYICHDYYPHHRLRLRGSLRRNHERCHLRHQSAGPSRRSEPRRSRSGHPGGRSSDESLGAIFPARHNPCGGSGSRRGQCASSLAPRSRWKLLHRAG
jgi:acyl-homoserine lactone acylase PvdQ